MGDCNNYRQTCGPSGVTPQRVQIVRLHAPCGVMQQLPQQPFVGGGWILHLQANHDAVTTSWFKEALFCVEEHEMGGEQVSAGAVLPAGLSRPKTQLHLVNGWEHEAGWLGCRQPGEAAQPRVH